MPGENQVSFIERGERDLYGRFPDTTQRSRYLLKCWREAGGDRELSQISSERFPASEFHTVHDSPIFAEHTTTNSRGERVHYDRKKLAAIVKACNERILDTGDFAVLSEGHTPDADAMSTGAKMPPVLGYVGPYRLGKIGNRKPRWAIFADEHYHRSDIEKLKRLPRRSPELFLEDMILDPIAALGAETPRLDTGIVRNCRNAAGQLVEKYSAMTYPSAVSTSPQKFRGGKETYAAGDEPMDDPANQPGNPEAEALERLGDADLNKIILGVSAAILQSKPLQWVVSQMPPDWTPGEGEKEGVPGEQVTGEPGEQVPGEEGGIPGDEPEVQLPPGTADAATDSPVDDDIPGDEAAFEGDDTHFDPEAGGGLDDVPADDAPADETSETPSAPPEDSASDAEMGEMDDDEKEKYAAFDSAGRRGFLWAWRRRKRHRGDKYAADCGEPTMPKPAEPPAKEKENYSRLAAENQQLRTRLDTMERGNREKYRKDCLTDLRKEHAFDLNAELEDVKDATDEQFTKHCERIKRNYSRIPREGEMPTLHGSTADSDPVAAIARDPEQAKKFSRMARERAIKSIKNGKHMTFETALEQVMNEAAAGAATK